MLWRCRPVACVLDPNRIGLRPPPQNATNNSAIDTICIKTCHFMKACRSEGAALADDRQGSGGPSPEVRRLAVFDYDGTIIDGQSGSLLSGYLLRRGLIPLRTALRLLWWGTRYKLHLPYRQDEARELIFDALRSLEPARIARVMHDFHDEVLAPLVRGDAVAEIDRRRREGCVTLMVSATFQAIADIAGNYLGVDGVAATRMELDKAGRYTGRVLGEVVAGQEKPRAAARWANAHLGEGAWMIAYAYGDHFSDEPLLERADTCFAVCPGATLRKLAQRRGWEILDWK